jgi:hypothetical protein
MANMMTTYVKIVNLNDETRKKVLDLFSTPENSSYVNIIENLNKVYGENFTDGESLSREWMDDNVGSKSLEIETSSDGEESDYFDLILTSAWGVPTGYLEKLTSLLNEIDEEVALYGTYEDESYEPMGAFVYAYDYDDMEDYDEVDSEKMWEDDDYREEMHDELHEHRDSLWESYLEVKKDREEE